MTSINAAMPANAEAGAGYAEVAQTASPDQAVSGKTGHVTAAPAGDLAETGGAPAGPSEFSLLGIPKPLVTALMRQGIASPFPIQRATIPDILSGRHVLGRGQTGSGKTLAFGLPTMALVAGVKAAPRRPLAIVLVPTRELAMQVTDALEPLGRGLALRMKTVVGGMSMGRQIEALRRGVEIVVATPGRLTDLIQQGECSLEDVKVTVIDEADHMCDLGFFPVVSALLQQTPADSQRLLFSATLDGDVDKLVRRFLKDPVTHSLSPATSSVDTMEHHVLQVSRDDKFAITAEIANREGRTIMFVRTQHGVDRLVKQLARVGVRAGGLHGGKRQNQRTRILAEFREGTIGVLVVHRRGRPRHPRGRRQPRAARRPADGPQELPAPWRPHGPRRRAGHRHDPGPPERAPLDRDDDQARGRRAAPPPGHAGPPAPGRGRGCPAAERRGDPRVGARRPGRQAPAPRGLAQWRRPPPAPVPRPPARGRRAPRHRPP